LQSDQREEMSEDGAKSTLQDEKVLNKYSILTFDRKNNNLQKLFEVHVSRCGAIGKQVKEEM
jgi:hypothetical protein